ncbi:MAG: FecR domain-containing protein [Candidatus Andeanibacterium colombiense]|uniref:FecR domain-containing protein n=1 Tax=Candidatus Andeanibacterium colombiense TaxID=3121345 RepID=A0AAJ5X3A6_9SPHN|nr:MAG: FecR domain-containing protein [Sphingomonadaceae bacterium]
MAITQFKEGDSLEPTTEMYEEAAGWIMRLRESAEEADLEGFRGWLAGQPARHFALAEMEALSEGVRAPAAAELAADRRRSALRRRWSVAALAASLVLALTGIAQREALTVALLADDTAPAGQQHRVRLADGTLVTLNSGAALDERFSRARRDVTLMRGEAFFDVAKNKARPFVIGAGDARVTVVGTHFNVKIDREQTVVTVEGGIVRLGAQRGGKEIRLTAGQQGFVEGGRVQAQPNFDALAVSAWRRGQMVFYTARLDEVVAELNRYRSGHIYVANRAYAGETISGVFGTKDTDDVIRTLEKQTGLRSLDLPGGMVVLY